MISREVCQRVLKVAVSTGADYAEIFAENTVNNAISMITNKVDNIRNTVIAGAAVRVLKGLRSVMASTVDTSLSGLLACADQAAEALGQGSAQIDKRDPLILTMKDWIDQEYEDGRQTVMTDKEIEEMLERLAPGRFRHH